MSSALEILKKYWNYDSFRPLQAEIVDHVVASGDAFVLMPTGGGKSLCFQVPALMMDGLTLVISPLISLIKDQVSRLRRSGIQAEGIYSGMDKKNIHRILGNCTTGKIRLLYLSPERLSTSLFNDYAGRLKVSMIVVDEAHCISQWGYDFRPAYLNIRDVRAIYPSARVMALTASATPEVVKDIRQILQIGDARIFRQSFLRDNLTYVCRNTRDKRGALLNLISKVSGSGIIYCRSRRATAEVANFLKSHGILAGFYHAGLDNERLAAVQQAWMDGKIRIMVATTAFGMGIDKADVRFVAHLALPSSPEEYYQEAGRGGRDGKKSYAALYYDEEDIIDLVDSVDGNFPDAEQLIRLYHRLALYFQVGAGPLDDEYFDFDLNEFCRQYDYKPVWVIRALKELEHQSYITVTEGIYLPNQVMFLYNKAEIYDFQLRHPDYDTLIEALLRLYGGILSLPVKININIIAQKLRQTPAEIIEKLEYLDRAGVIDFQRQKDKPQLSFRNYRYDAEALVFNFDLQSFLRERYREKVNAMVAFAQSPVCRNITLLDYFGEKAVGECGICDVCLENKRSDRTKDEIGEAMEYLINFASTQHHTMSQLITSPFYISNKDAVRLALQHLMDEGRISIDNFKLQLNE